MELNQSYSTQGHSLETRGDYLSNVVSDADYIYCQKIMRAASKNYSFASRFFPSDKLRHIEALYALMRIGDDRVDVSHTGFSSALEAIEDWEQSYWHTFSSGNSPHPVLRAYLNTAKTFDIPAEIMAPYFQAMKDDLLVNRFPTFSDLLSYMDGSALPVGKAMTHILGVRDPFTIQQALHHADSLSVAMQLSNFWRDIGYDWKINRVYIPQEDLRDFGVNEDDLASKRISKEFIQLLEFEFHRTETYYQNAREGIQMLATGRWAVMSGLEIYRSIIKQIRENNYDVFNLTAGSSKTIKIGLALKAWWNIIQ